MADGPPAVSPGDNGLEEVLIGQLDWAIRQVHGMIVDLEASEGGSSDAERRRVVMRLRESLSQVTKERSLVQELRLRDAGADTALFDADEVRAEIARRLDRLGNA